MGCKCHVVVKIVFGLLLLLNAFIWPKWLDLSGWIAWVAILMIVFGVIKLVVPQCKCEGNCCQVPEAPAKKKK